MKSIIVGVLVVALSGCAVCREHPGACAVATSVAVTSLALCMGKNKGSGGNDHDVVIRPPSCPGVSCQ